MLGPRTDPAQQPFPTLAGPHENRKQLASPAHTILIVPDTRTTMKLILPKYSVLLAITALGLSVAGAQNLEQQKETAAKIAAAQGKDEAKATSIAQNLGDAFGPSEDSEALLQAVEQMSAQSPDDAAAIAAAATAFNPTPEFAARAAAAAARGAPSAANAIAAAVASAVPTADAAVIAQAAQTGAQEGTAVSGDSGGGSGGSPPAPTGFGGGGGGSSGSSGDS